MEKKKTNNKNIIKFIKILTVILLIILISMIGFFGIYKQDKNKMANSIKDYSYSMAINGARNIKLVINSDTTEVIKDSEGNVIEEATDEEIEKNNYIVEEVPVISEEIKTVENYNKSKEIIEKRLKKMGVEEYNISLNTKTGEVAIEIPEDDQTDKVIKNLVLLGKFEIIDSETREVLLDNSNIESSRVLYNTETTGTSVYLEIAFNKEGKSKLEEISKTYIHEENEEDNEVTSENVEDENETDLEDSEENVKEITMKIDDEEIMTTHFSETITTGKIQLSIGTATTNAKTLQGYISQAETKATELDSGNLPIEYEIEKDQYIFSSINKEQIANIIIIATIALGVVVTIILTIRYKTKGILAGIAYIGLEALYLLLIRYTNVVISIESIFGIAVALILDLIFTIILLKNIENRIKENKEDIVNKATVVTYKKFFNRIISICIMAVVFCFIKWIPINSFGMIMFWGLVMIAVYNVVITRYLLKTVIDEK